MAIAFVQKTAQFTVSALASVTSGSLTTTAGNTGFLTVAHFTSGGASAPTITDGKGNTGTVDKSTVEVSSGNARASIGSIPLANAGAGHTWTINFSGSSFCEGNVTEVSGISATPLDQTAAAQPATGTNTTATTPNTTVSDEIVIGCIVTNTADTTTHITDPPTGYTSIGVKSDDTATIGYEGCYLIVSSTGAQAASWAWDNTVSAGGAAAAASLATYKIGTGAVADGSLVGQSRQQFVMGLGA